MSQNYKSPSEAWYGKWLKVDDGQASAGPRRSTGKVKAKASLKKPAPAGGVIVKKAAAVAS